MAARTITMRRARPASFPGFTHDTHGIESEGGVYRLLVLK
jgi:hypothetical protein